MDRLPSIDRAKTCIYTQTTFPLPSQPMNAATAYTKPQGCTWLRLRKATRRIN